MKPLYIFDLDGTLALNGHREHLAKAGRWDAFFEACDTDLPNQPVIDTFIALKATSELWIWSGRSASVVEKTATWLTTHVTDMDGVQLQMRPVGDYTPDEKLKRRWLDSLRHDDLARLRAVFDDRAKVVSMWRDCGVPCFQVAPGDF